MKVVSKSSGSKTVRFNLYQLLGTLALVIGAYAGMPGLPEYVYVLLGFASMIVSEVISYTTPSGTWAPNSEDWTAGKWIYRVGNSILIILAYTSGKGYLVEAIALLTPVVEIIVRRYGSGNETQIAAAERRAA